jgi:predicted lipid-binding transport protein (Tim44 family)
MPGSSFLDIVIFALVAVFLGLRLRSVLGRRTGEEPPPAGAMGNGVIGPAPSPRPVGEVVALPAADPLTEGINRIRSLDPGFDPKVFLNGAARAFEMIVRAFAHGEEMTLRRLLADDVYAQFSAAIRARRAAGETNLSEFVDLVSVELADAALDGPLARITVKFVSHQRIAIQDATGAIIEGDPDRLMDIVDTWSFGRDLRSTDPNWLLVATRPGEE